MNPEDLQTPIDMTGQAWLRRRIAILEARQVQRRILVAVQKAGMDSVVEKCDRELENLKAQISIGVAR